MSAAARLHPALWALLLTGVVFPARAHAQDLHRFALFVGNNNGGSGTRPLLYAADDARRQFLDRLDIAQAGVFHEEADRIAMRAATEAVVKLLSRADRERGRFFVMERAASAVIGPSLL